MSENTYIIDTQSIRLSSSYKTRKRIVLAAFALAILIFGQYIFSVVRADMNALDGAFESGTQLHSEAAINMNITKRVKEKFDVLIFNDDSVLLGVVGDSSQKTFDTLSSIVITVASGLILIYIVIYIIKESMRGDPTFDFWIKVFFILALAVFVTTQWNSIMSSISKVGKVLISSIDFTEVKPVDNAPYNRYYDKNKNRSLSKEEQAFRVADYNQLYDKNNDGILSFAETKARYTEEISSGLEWMYVGDMITSKDVEIDDKLIAAYADAKNNPDNTEKQSTLFEQLGSTVQDVLGNEDWNNYLGLTGVEGFIFKIAQIGLNIAIDGQILFIALQLLIRKLFAPLALADITTEGMRSPGVRYLKRYFALYIQCAIILILSVVMFWMMKAIVTNTKIVEAFSMRLVVLMIGLSTFTASITQSGNLANELVGD